MVFYYQLKQFISTEKNLISHLCRLIYHKGAKRSQTTEANPLQEDIVLLGDFPRNPWKYAILKIYDLSLLNRMGIPEVNSKFANK